MTTACPACSAAPLATDTAVSPPGPVTLSIPDIRCAACIRSVEDRLQTMSGVKDARVNLTLKRVNIDTALPTERLISALAEIGYEAFALDAAALGSEQDPVGQNLMLRVGVAGFAMMNVMLLSVAVWSGAADATRDLFHLVSAAIALPATLFSAQPFFTSAWSAVRATRLNMDVPISLAILLAGGMSLFETLNGGAHAYFDAALSLTFFLLIGRVLEHKTRAAAQSAAKELAALEVQTAKRKIGERVETVPVRDLAIDDRIVVPSGVRVPVDGALLSASGTTDRSFLTGESEPAVHAVGAALRAGEINLGAPFEMITRAVGDDTQLRRMAALVETAENVRNTYTSLADRAAQIYAPAVHLLAAATFVGWFVATGDIRHSLNIAIAVLIITCPCALGLAVPAVSTAAIGRLYRMGFLVKSGTALERLAEVDTVLLDKTGTLTTPGFVFDLAGLPTTAKGVARGLADASSHPVSQALARYLADTDPEPVIGLTETAGKGVRGRWGSCDVALGRGTWLGTEEDLLTLRIGEDTYALPFEEGLVAGAADLGSGLTEIGLEAHILSGDSEAKTEALAARLAIGEWHAGLSPEDKHRYVVEVTGNGTHHPCMVGDGINDTVALTAAHASVAPGSALDAARNAADVVMIGNTLGRLPDLFKISRKAIGLYRQNFAIALGYNALAIPLAIAGYATPLMAALAMSASSLTVLLNAMRARY